MYNRVFKNYQINVGIPFQVKVPAGLQTAKHHNRLMEQQSNEVDITEDEIENAEDIIHKAREEANLLLKEAEFEAERIIDNARQKAREESLEIMEQARKEGYEEGYNAGKQQHIELICEAEKIKENAETEYCDILEGIENDVISMVIDISKKVIGEEISLNRENILYVVKQAFEKCTNKDNVILRVAPDDYEFIVDNKEKVLSMVEGMGEFDIKKDFSLKAASCVVETPFGCIDASIQTKLRKIEEAFKQVLVR